MKKILPLAVGVTAGMFAAPMVMGLVGIQPAPGFGVDDVVEIAIIVGTVLLADKLIG